MKSITICLWFDNQAEEAAKFYTSVFKDSKILNYTHYSVDTPSNKPVGSVMTVAFEIKGQKIVALNGGPYFKFNESVSFMVDCQSQEEIDYYWEKLSSDKSAEQCGWLKDKYGLSWQIVPSILDEMVDDKDRGKAKRVMESLLKMKKIEIDGLKKAYEGK